MSKALTDLFDPFLPNEKIELIIRRYADRGRLKELLREYHLDWLDFTMAVKKSPILSAAMTAAQEARAEVLVDEAIEIADIEPDANRARVRVDMRKWAASKFNRTKFSDHVELTLREAPDLNAALEEARKRALPKIVNPLLIEKAEPCE